MNDWKNWHAPVTTIDDLPGSPPRAYAALDCPAWVNGKEVLLACEKNEDPTARKVIALFPNEARALHAEGRLEGWTPIG